MPSVKVYLGGLPEGTTEERLRDLFESQRLEAELSEGVRIKKGYAFAVFADEDRAKEAIAKLNGNDVVDLANHYPDQCLKVCFAAALQGTSSTA